MMPIPTKNEQWPADHVEKRPIASLIFYARNSRTHSDEQVGQIAASIRQWGWTVPVLIDEQGTLIAGHGRVLAAQRLGITEVPCMVARDWSDAKRRAYNIADNKLALNAGWDNDLLKLEFDDLNAVDFDLTLTGFNPTEMANLYLGENALDIETEKGQSAGVTGDIYVVVGKYKIPCTVEEMDAMAEKLDEHVDQFGSLRGFFGGLLDA